LSDHPLFVHMRWIDSNGDKGWKAVYDVQNENDVTEIETIGWLILEDEHGVTVAAHWSAETKGSSEQVHAPLCIPKVAITYLRRFTHETLMMKLNRAVRRKLKHG
jgi:hypothetical protein